MPLQFLDAKSIIFAGVNPFEVSDYVGRNVGNHRLRLKHSSSATASLKHRRAGSVDLCRLSYGTEARILSDGLADIYHAQFILRGTCRYSLPEAELDLSAGHFLLINPNEPLDLTYSSDCEKFIVKIPSAMVREACTEHRWFIASDCIKFHQIPYRFDDLSNLVMLLNLLCEEAESGKATPQMLQHYCRVVTTKLMVMLKHNVSMVAPSRHAPSFERLVNYIERNIKLELGADELAQYAGLSLRSLYLLFEKNVKTTPKNFVRQKKLEKVHSILNDPAQACPNVTAVALEYGFSHLGRFSELYKSTYGVLPSQSIRCRQPQAGR